MFSIVAKFSLIKTKLDEQKTNPDVAQMNCFDVLSIYVDSETNLNFIFILVMEPWMQKLLRHSLFHRWSFGNAIIFGADSETSFCYIFGVVHK